MSDDVQFIVIGIHEAKQQISEIAKRAQKEIDVEKEKIAAFQKQCGHKLTKYHGDPSGNNDSWDECLICGKDD